MNIRQEILKVPESLRETLEKGRPGFEAVVRETRWSARPLFLVGRGASHLAALTGALAFESVLGLPVVVRRALDFRAYSASVLDSRSILFAVSQSGESADTLECAHAARRRGSTVLALTASPATKLAQLADRVFVVPAGEEEEPRVRTALCQQAALGAISLLAARIVKAPDPEVASVEEDLLKLPAEIERTLAHFRDAMRALAAELAGAKSLSVVGAGFYYPAALQWSRLVERLLGIPVACFTPDEFDEFRPRPHRVPEPAPKVVVLSSSRCKLKAQADEVARACHKAGTGVFSITDSADRELATRSSLAVLLPTLHELPGSILTLALLDWVAWEMSREKVRPA
ncbi:MAG TPA: SIS domain-containing protein [Terriglobia bacterium]|nr:SIS domain-containing protein [Terriglobia bacterium]